MDVSSISQEIKHKKYTFGVNAEPLKGHGPKKKKTLNLKSFTTWCAPENIQYLDSRESFPCAQESLSGSLCFQSWQNS